MTYIEEIKLLTDDELDKQIHWFIETIRFCRETHGVELKTDKRNLRLLRKEKSQRKDQKARFEPPSLEGFKVMADKSPYNAVGLYLHHLHKYIAMDISDKPIISTDEIRLIENWLKEAFKLLPIWAMRFCVMPETKKLEWLDTRIMRRE